MELINKKVEVVILMEYNGSVYERVHRYCRENNYDRVLWYVEDKGDLKNYGLGDLRNYIKMMCDVDVDNSINLEHEFQSNRSTFIIINEEIESEYRLRMDGNIYLRMEKYNITKDNQSVYWFSNGYDLVNFEEGWLNDKNDPFYNRIKELENKFQTINNPNRVGSNT